MSMLLCYAVDCRSQSRRAENGDILEALRVATLNTALFPEEITACSVTGKKLGYMTKKILLWHSWLNWKTSCSCFRLLGC